MPLHKGGVCPYVTAGRATGDGGARSYVKVGAYPYVKKDWACPYERASRKIGLTRSIGLCLNYAIDVVVKCYVAKGYRVLVVLGRCSEVVRWSVSEVDEYSESEESWQGCSGNESGDESGSELGSVNSNLEQNGRQDQIARVARGNGCQDNGRSASNTATVPITSSSEPSS